MEERIIRPPDSETKRYIIYIVRYVGHDGEVYTRECSTDDKEAAIREAERYRKSGRRVAICEETTTIKTLFTSEVKS